MTLTIPGPAMSLRLLLLAAGWVLLLVVADPRLAPSTLRPAPPVEVVVDGRQFSVSPSVAGSAARLSADRLEVGRAEAQAHVRELVGRELDRVFDSVHERLPAYADWFYSLGGEYARLSWVVLGAMGKLDGDPLAARAAEIVFDGALFEQRIERVFGAVNEGLALRIEATGRDWLAEVVAVFERQDRPRRAPGPQPTIALDDVLGDFVGSGSGAFAGRLTASSAASAGVVVGPLVARVAARPTVSGGGRAVAARTAARTLGKSGTAGSGAVLGCGVTGPAALPCALAVGSAAWLATDWLLLQADEWVHRDALIADWERRLEALRADLEAVLLAYYEAQVDAWYDDVSGRVERTFSPVAGSFGR